MAILENIIINPMITEKVSLGTDSGNTYGFRVILKANKNQIRNAVEKLYNVKVLRVNTIVNPGKVKRRKTKVTKTSKWKKALVQIEKGQKIELFKDV